MRSLISRTLIALALTASLAACGNKTDKVSADDMSLGNPEAKVTVVEYASVTCPHCARWGKDVFPAFKAKYVDTNQVRFVYREFPTAPANVAAAGFLTARCAGKDKYFEVVDSIYRQQEDLFADPRGTLLRVAEAAGLSEAQFTACVEDKKALEAFNERVERYSKTANIQGTPTIVVNGEKVGGEQGGEVTLAQLDAAIAQARK